jgi:FixJ family two-component response regulator
MNNPTAQKPLIYYIDDEVRNLTVFEALLPDTWAIKTFESAIDALKSLKTDQPCIIVSDQRMPQMTGLEFLEIASQIVPNSIRIVVTGQTDESTIIQLIRRAKIFDFITKPWDPELLLSQIEKAINFFQLEHERNWALSQLENQNKELKDLTTQLEAAKEEISSWVPRALLMAIDNKEIEKIQRRNLVGITYDIINSSGIVDKEIEGRSIRAHVIKLFTEVLIKHGGIRESSSGDSVYGHFGAFNTILNSVPSALAVAQEFRVSLRNFSRIHNIDIECGIGIGFVEDALVQVHEINAEFGNEKIKQKSFDTTNRDIDLIFRIEKLIHELPGTSIIVTEKTFERLEEQEKSKFKPVNNVFIKGNTKAQNLYVLLSDRVNAETWSQFSAKHQSRNANENLTEESTLVSPVKKAA